MTKEDKELLLKDLCARLPYEVILSVTLKDKYDEIVTRDIQLSDGNLTYITRPSHWREYKPYLRPMSSMTEEEKIEYGDRCYFTLDCISGNQQYYFNELYDWLNAHHFDFMGLIPKNLAIEVTESNNPYENNN